MTYDAEILDLVNDLYPDGLPPSCTAEMISTLKDTTRNRQANTCDTMSVPTLTGAA